MHVDWENPIRPYSPEPGDNANLLSPQAIAYRKRDSIFVSHDNDEISKFRGNGILKDDGTADDATSRGSLLSDCGFGSLAVGYGNDDIIWTASEVGGSNDKEKYVRFIMIDLDTEQTVAQYMYKIETDDGYDQQDIVALAPIDQFRTYLVLQHIETTAEGFNTKLYAAVI